MSVNNENNSGSVQVKSGFVKGVISLFLTPENIIIIMRVITKKKVNLKSTKKTLTFCPKNGE